MWTKKLAGLKHPAAGGAVGERRTLLKLSQ